MQQNKTDAFSGISRSLYQREEVALGSPRLLCSPARLRQIAHLSHLERERGPVGHMQPRVLTATFCPDLEGSAPLQLCQAC